MLPTWRFNNSAKDRISYLKAYLYEEQIVTDYFKIKN